MKLRVILFTEDEWWIAQGLEQYLTTQGHTMEETIMGFEEMIIGHIMVALENGFVPFSMGEAPAEYHDRWAEGRPIHTSPPTWSAFVPPDPVVPFLPELEYRMVETVPT